MMTENFSAEIMDMEQLDEVSGGHYDETCKDTEFLKDIGLVDISHSEFVAFFCSGPARTTAATGWSKVGISFIGNYRSINEYYYNGKRIFRDEAMKIACQKKGVKLTDLSLHKYSSYYSYY